MRLFDQQKLEQQKKGKSSFFAFSVAWIKPFNHISSGSSKFICSPFLFLWDSKLICLLVETPIVHGFFN